MKMMTVENEGRGSRNDDADARDDDYDESPRREEKRRNCVALDDEAVSQTLM